jgi:hypothetical protein
MSAEKCNNSVSPCAESGAALFLQGMSQHLGHHSMPMMRDVVSFCSKAKRPDSFQSRLLTDNI